MSSPDPSRAAVETTALGTLGWVAVVALGAVLAVVLLSWLGPVGGQ